MNRRGFEERVCEEYKRDVRAFRLKHPVLSMALYWSWLGLPTGLILMMVHLTGGIAVAVAGLAISQTYKFVLAYRVTRRILHGRDGR